MTYEKDLAAVIAAAKSDPRLLDEVIFEITKAFGNRVFFEWFMDEFEALEEGLMLLENEHNSV